MTTLDTRPRAPVLRPLSLGSSTGRRPGLKMAMAPLPQVTQWCCDSARSCPRHVGAGPPPTTDRRDNPAIFPALSDHPGDELAFQATAGRCRTEGNREALTRADRSGSSAAGAAPGMSTSQI